MGAVPETSPPSRKPWGIYSFMQTGHLGTITNWGSVTLGPYPFNIKKQLLLSHSPPKQKSRCPPTYKIARASMDRPVVPNHWSFYQAPCAKHLNLPPPWEEVCQAILRKSKRQVLEAQSDLFFLRFLFLVTFG